MLVDALLKKHGYLPSPCFNDMPPGWEQLIDKLLADLRTLNVSRLSQIKEKFGTLRVYVEYPEDAPDEVQNQIDALIIEAERKSAITCSQCGAGDAYISKGYWRVTLCSACHV